MHFQYYMAITVRSGSPHDPPRSSYTPRRSWIDLVPTALCIGPLKGLAISGKDDRKLVTGLGRTKAVREITKAREKAAAKEGNGRRAVEGDTVVKEGEMTNSRAGRNARTCKKCPPNADGHQPIKPGSFSPPFAPRIGIDEPLNRQKERITAVCASAVSFDSTIIVPG